MAEKVTQQEQAEEMRFLEAVTATAPMQYVHQYLARKVLPPYLMANLHSTIVGAACPLRQNVGMPVACHMHVTH